MWFGHRKEILKLTFRGLALRRIESIRSDEGLTLETWPIHIINPVDKTQLSCSTSHRRSTTVWLETYTGKLDPFTDLMKCL